MCEAGAREIVNLGIQIVRASSSRAARTRVWPRCCPPTGAGTRVQPELGDLSTGTLPAAPVIPVIPVDSQGTSQQSPKAIIDYQARHLEVRRWQETGSPQTPSKTMPVMSVGIGSKDGKVFENQIAAFSCTTAEYINEIDQHRPRTLPSGRRQAEGQALDQASLEGSQSLD